MVFWQLFAVYGQTTESALVLEMQLCFTLSTRWKMSSACQDEPLTRGGLYRRLSRFRRWVGISRCELVLSAFLLSIPRLRFALRWFLVSVPLLLSSDMNFKTWI